MKLFFLLSVLLSSMVAKSLASTQTRQISRHASTTAAHQVQSQPLAATFSDHMSKPKPSGISCCSLPSKSLKALQGGSDKCPSFARILSLVTKCQKCPVGTCRVGYSCYCPDAFLGSSSLQRDCLSSYTVVWPASVKKEDLDWRSCNTKKKPKVKPSGESCCSMSATQLTKIRGITDSCPTFSRVLSLVTKCQKCPVGTCRIGYSCYCPEAFLGSSSLQRDCLSSYTVVWPPSVKKEDLDWRSCNTKKKPKVKPSGESCCSMSAKQLTKIRGITNSCPTFSRVLSLVTKCQKCPVGTCRIGYSCYCPEAFLGSSSLQRDCLSSFTVAWPPSVKKEDLDWRSCNTKKKPKVKPSGESCCSMSAKQLTKIRGITNSCPTFSRILSLASKCQKCPVGTCRVGYSCYCPEAFLGSSSLQRDCLSSFTVAWPPSVKKEDLDWRSCNTKKKPKDKPSNVSCCALSAKELTKIRGITDSCPTFSRILSQSGKCQKCPVGTCRLGQACYCPEAFLGNTSLQRSCSSSFTVAWPASVKKKDIDC